MAEGTREVWVTGIGIVSCLGEGPDAHWQKLTEAKPAADTTTFAPFIVHPLAPINFDAQIPKKGDQRQMENWQRIGTYAAGLALEFRRGQRQDRYSLAYGYDRRRRRRRTRSDCRFKHSQRHRAGRKSGGIPQRATDERSAPHLVPGAAFQFASPAIFRSCMA